MFGDKCTNIFRPFKGFFGELNSFDLKYSRNLFKFYGGEVVSDLDIPETLYFCELRNLKKHNDYNKFVKYVNCKWILDCKNNNKILDLKEYEI